jgi:hypothetical protein
MLHYLIRLLKIQISDHAQNRYQHRAGESVSNRFAIHVFSINIYINKTSYSFLK